MDENQNKYLVIADYLSNSFEHDTEEEAVSYLLENCDISSVEVAKNLINSYIKEQRELLRMNDKEMMIWVFSKTVGDELKRNPGKPLVKIVFVGYDEWGRATFKDADGYFFCDTSCSNYDEGKPFNKDLYFKGKDFEGEPECVVPNLVIVSKLEA